MSAFNPDKAEKHLAYLDANEQGRPRWVRARSLARAHGLSLKEARKIVYAHYALKERGLRQEDS